MEEREGGEGRRRHSLSDSKPDRQSRDAPAGTAQCIGPHYRMVVLALVVTGAPQVKVADGRQVYEDTGIAHHSHCVSASSTASQSWMASSAV